VLNLLWSAVHGLQHWRDWLMKEIIAPIRHELAHVGDLAGQAVQAAITSFYNTTIAPIVHNVDHLTTIVDGWAQVLTADTLKALSLLKDAAWFLIKVAEYTPDVLSSMFAWLEGESSKAVTPTPAQLTEVERDLDAFFKSLL
jgi:hypothetical protein